MAAMLLLVISPCYGDKMKVIMKVMLACPLGVFHPGDVYENNEAACRALIADGCAYDPISPGPPSEPVEAPETAEAPEMETAVKPKPRRSRLGRPRKKK